MAEKEEGEAAMGSEEEGRRGPFLDTLVVGGLCLLVDLVPPILLSAQLASAGERWGLYAVVGLSLLFLVSALGLCVGLPCLMLPYLAAQTVALVSLIALALFYGTYFLFTGLIHSQHKYYEHGVDPLKVQVWQAKELWAPYFAGLFLLVARVHLLSGAVAVYQDLGGCICCRPKPYRDFTPDESMADSDRTE